MSTGEVKKSLLLPKSASPDSHWQSLTTATSVFPCLLGVSDLVKVKPNLDPKSKPKCSAKKPPPKRRRRRRQPSTWEGEEGVKIEMEEEEEGDDFTSPKFY
ncbi:unnamed protein product [Hydatigera taeniaeformis]|uniref:Uncharacterized protein n=1 Tax=Hydatigena taeniaeformis TaxID=6205 RepID=A0A0R3XAP5_HYDTA|nr:unnamed protein product [Hydatigera taeniaeformis]